MKVNLKFVFWLCSIKRYIYSIFFLYFAIQNFSFFVWLKLSICYGYVFRVIVRQAFSPQDCKWIKFILGCFIFCFLLSMVTFLLLYLPTSCLSMWIDFCILILQHTTLLNSLTVCNFSFSLEFLRYTITSSVCINKFFSSFPILYFCLLLV